MRFVRLTTAAGAQEPASLEDLKAYGRIVSADEDRVLEQLLLAARQEVERYSGHVLVPGTFSVFGDEWAKKIDLPLTPVREVTWLKYHYSVGVEETVDADTYFADFSVRPERIAFRTWGVQPYALRPSGGIELEVVAGYEKRSDVPEDIRQHVMTQALLMFEHRDDPDMLDKVRRYAANGASAFAVVSV